MAGVNTAGLMSAIPAVAGNYLSSTIFLAALFHGIVIMGVTFTAPDGSDPSGDVTSLEVVLITGDYEERRAPDDAQMLADRSVSGTGTTTEDTPVRVAYGRDAAPTMPGPPQEGTPNVLNQGAPQSSMQMTVVARNETSPLHVPEKVSREAETQQAERGLPGAENPIEILAEPDRETVLTSTAPRELVISANTRESRIAAYLDSWKRKVERVGTLNFPHDLSERSDLGNPTLEVAIAADGTLEEIIVLASSSDRRLDQAAVEILQMAAPFEPFPDYLSNEYDVLRFSYQWQFSGESTVRASMSMAIDP